MYGLCKHTHFSSATTETHPTDLPRRIGEAVGPDHDQRIGRVVDDFHLDRKIRARRARCEAVAPQADEHDRLPFVVLNVGEQGGGQGRHGGAVVERDTKDVGGDGGGEDGLVEDDGQGVGGPGRREPVYSV